MWLPMLNAVEKTLFPKEELLKDSHQKRNLRNQRQKV